MIRALLCPVPEMHLRSAVKDGIAETGVLFGTNDWQLFETDGGVEEGAPVYIYASIAEEPTRPFMVSWQAIFVRYLRHEEMHHSDFKRRPTLTKRTDTPWGGYWEVRDLHELDTPFPVSDLSTPEGRRLQDHAPHGPLAIGR